MPLVAASGVLTRFLGAYMYVAAFEPKWRKWAWSRWHRGPKSSNSSIPGFGGASFGSFAGIVPSLGLALLKMCSVL